MAATGASSLGRDREGAATVARMRVIVKTVAAVLAVASVAACRTPYQPLGTRGGFREERLSPDTFFVEVIVNTNTSTGTARGYLYRRAQELCHGAGYPEFVLLDESSRSGALYGTSDIVSSRDKPRTSALVRCFVRHAGPSPAAAPQAPAPAPAHIGGEREPCRADGLCDDGLTCASSRCVRLAAPASDVRPDEPNATHQPVSPTEDSRP